MNEVSVVLVGMGGYGNIYARMLLEGAAEHGARLVAGIDPYAERSGNQEKFRQAGIMVYADLADFFRLRKSRPGGDLHGNSPARPDDAAGAAKWRPCAV